MKKIIALVLTLVMVASLSVLCVSAAAEKIGDTNTTWEVKDGVLTISGTGASPAFESQNDVVIGRPWESQIDSITKVVITSGVTEIGARSFSKMTAMKEIVFGADVKKINADAFSYNSALETVTFEGKVETIGQGIVFGSNNVQTVNLPADWTYEEFKEVATVARYNFKENGGLATGFDSATYVVGGVVPAFGTELTIKPSVFGDVENWNNKTWFLTQVDSSSNSKLYGNLKNGTWTADIIIKDETTGEARIIKGYAFDDAGNEFYGTDFLRIAVCEYGIIPELNHAYTLTMNVYEGTELIASGATETGAFDQFNADFTANGPIVPENPTHSSEVYDPTVVPTPTPTPTPVDPPKTADASVYMIVVAVVAVLGMAVVVTKKVNA